MVFFKFQLNLPIESIAKDSMIGERDYVKGLNEKEVRD